MKFIFLLCLFGLQVSFLQAQTISSSQYREHPYWISMMEDPTSNYYETVKAFDMYWENRERPSEESEIFALSELEKASFTHEIKESSFSTLSQRDIALAYKKFNYWQIKVSSNINSDGHILTPEERIQRWNLQQEDRK